MSYAVTAGTRRRSYNPNAYPAISAPLFIAYDASQQVQTSGSAVTTLTDYSGNAVTGTYGGSGAVTYNATGLNNHPTFNFAGGGYFDTPTFAAITSSTAITIVIVGQFTDLTGGRLIVVGTPNTTAGMLNNSGAQYYFSRGGTTATGGAVNSAVHRYRYVLAASGATATSVYTDNVLAYGPIATGTGQPTKFRFAADNSGYNQFIGNISELRIFKGALSDTEATNLDNYLSNKWS